MRVFHSYGHDQYAVLASRLQQDLETQGHKVWFDVARLKPRGDWERYIEEGLDWASAVPGEGRFLLLLAPHSVRRPDGYCLNELARAFGLTEKKSVLRLTQRLSPVVQILQTHISHQKYS